MNNNIIKYQYIDALRGVAILMVIMLHTFWAVNAHVHQDSTLALIANYCQMGVQLFFVVSAYTLSMSYVKRSSEPCSLMSFYLRRVFRIAPLYYVGMATYLLLEVIVEFKHGNTVRALDKYNALSVMSNIFLVHGFIPTAMNSVVHGGWSIGIEMIFYAIFPFVFICSKRLTKSYILSTYLLFILAVALNVLIQIYIFEYLHQSIVRNNYIYFSIFNQLPVFVLGILAFHIFDILEYSLSQLLFMLGYVFFTVIALVLWLTNNQYYFAIIPSLSGISFVFLLGWVKYSKADFKIIAKIGNVSYSMYIFHFIISWNVIPAILKRSNLILDQNIVLLLAFFASVFFSYIVAQFTADIIEKQGVSIGARVIEKLQNKYSN